MYKKLKLKNKNFRFKMKIFHSVRVLLKSYKCLKKASGEDAMSKPRLMIKTFWPCQIARQGFHMSSFVAMTYFTEKYYLEATFWLPRGLFITVIITSSKLTWIVPLHRNTVYCLTFLFSFIVDWKNFVPISGDRKYNYIYI